MNKIVNHQRRRTKFKSPEGFQLDHIIPYSITLDDSKENIQFLKPLEHKEKTKIDFKILKEFRKKGWIEKISNYSHELKLPVSQLKEEYIKRFNKIKMNKT